MTMEICTSPFQYLIWTCFRALIPLRHPVAPKNSKGDKPWKIWTRDLQSSVHAWPNTRTWSNRICLRSSRAGERAITRKRCRWRGSMLTVASNLPKEAAVPAQLAERQRTRSLRMASGWCRWTSNPRRCSRCNSMQILEMLPTMLVTNYHLYLPLQKTIMKLPQTTAITALNLELQKLQLSKTMPIIK